MIGIISVFDFNKKILCVALITVFLFALTIGTSAEGKAFNESEELPFLSASSISLTGEDNNTVLELKSGEKVKASVEVKNNSDADAELSMIIVLSEANRMKKMYVETETVKAFPDDGVLFEKEITLPKNAENMVLSVMLWNDLEEMVNVCPALTIPGEVSGLRIITADGDILDGFDEDIEEYELEISSELSSPLKIKCAPLDGGTSVKTDEPLFFPGKTVIHTVSYLNTEKNYILKYVCNENLATEPTLSQYLNTRYLPVYKKNISVGDDCFSDKAAGKYSNFTYIDETLAGKDWFCCPANWAVLESQKKFWNGSAQGSLDMFGFNISKSAVIRVLAESKCTVEGSFSEDGGWKETVNITDPFYKRTSDNGEKEGTVMYEKTIHVKKGETETVSIPNHGGLATYIVIIDYLYN